MCSFVHPPALIQELYQVHTKVWKSKSDQNSMFLLLEISDDSVVEEGESGHFNTESKCQ